MKVRANLKQIESLTYQFSKDQADVLAELNVKVEELFNDFKSYLPLKEGLVVRPKDNQSVVIMKRKIRRAQLALKCSSLPATAKKVKLPKALTQRVGGIADRKRLLQV